jgi:hypothetical protein
LAVTSGIARSTLAKLRLAGLRRDGGAGRRPRRHERDQVADVDHAGRIVEGVVIDHEPGMGRVFEHAHQFADGDLLLHGDDVGARHHDALDPEFAQPKDILEHNGFFRREAGLRLLGGEHELEIGAGRRCLPAEQDAHNARQPAFPGLARLGHDHRQIAMLAVGRLVARR